MRWESLQFEQYGIYQDGELGRFTEDPVRLVHFLRAKRNERAVDLGTGNGIIPLYANAMYGCSFAGIDTDEPQLRLARLSAEKNGQQIPFYELDVSDAPKTLGCGRFDLVTLNPPYYPQASAGEDPSGQDSGTEIGWATFWPRLLPCWTTTVGSASAIGRPASSICLHCCG